MKQIKKNKKIKYTKPKIFITLLHDFCNEKIPVNSNIKLGNYSIEITEERNFLYYNSNPILILFKNENTYIIKESFDNGSGSRNCFNAYTLEKSIPEFYYRYFFKNIDNFISVKSLADLTDNDFANLIKETLIYNNQNYLNNVSFIKEFINNNRMTSIYYDSMEYDEKIFYGYGSHSIDLTFYEKYAKNLDKLYDLEIEYKSYCNKYKGWVKDGCYPMQLLKFKIKDYLENGCSIFYTEEENDIFKFKSFRKKYLLNENGSFKFSLKESKLIYYDLKKRKEYQEIYLVKKEKKEKERNKDRFKTAKTALDNLENWRSNKNTYLSSFYYYNFLKILPLKTPKPLKEQDYKDIIVETNARAYFTLQEAKILYTLFKKCIETSTNYVPEKTISISGYNFIGIFYKSITVLNIENAEDLKEEVIETWCIKVGCHTVIQSEIEAFIKYYNLNW
jgi:hypothetical protein